MVFGLTAALLPSCGHGYLSSGGDIFPLISHFGQSNLCLRDRFQMPSNEINQTLLLEKVIKIYWYIQVLMYKVLRNFEAFINMWFAWMFESSWF